MAGRAHERKGIMVRFFEDVIYRGYRRAGRNPGNLERLRADHSIKINERSASVAKVSEMLYEANAMAAGDLFVACGPRLYMFDARPQPIIRLQCREYRPQPFGVFGMVAGPVLHVSGVV
jgi:hypothetical protein